MSLCLPRVGETHLSLHPKRFSKWGLSPRSLFPRIQLNWCLRVHPGPLHLPLCVYGGSPSMRVQVAHGREWWSGSRLAAPVSIWCWQFTQAFFPLPLGVSTCSFPSQMALSPTLRAKSVKADYIQDTAWKWILLKWNEWQTVVKSFMFFFFSCNFALSWIQIQLELLAIIQHLTKWDSKKQQLFYALHL